EVRGMAELLAALEARGKASKPGDLVASNSDWHEAQLREKRLPHRRDLDRIAPDNPVVLVRGGHEFIVNSAAMRRWSISRATPVPPGGEIGHDAEGEMNGELVDTARGLVRLPPPPKLTEEQIIAQMKLLNAAGLTGIRIPGQFQFGGSAIEPYRMFQQLRAQGKLTLRVNYLMRIFDYSSVEKMRETIASWNIKPDEGDAPTDQVLDAAAAAARDRSIRGRRWSVEHFFIGRPGRYPRVKVLELVISAQAHLYRAGPSLVKYWGRERAEQVTPVRSFLDQGILVAGGTDSPVIPSNPSWARYHFISRETISDGVYGANQRITREEALRVFTINNAKLTFEENLKGSIERGKLADLVVLPADILTIPEKQIEGLKPVATMVGGRFVYGDPAVRLE